MMLQYKVRFKTSNGSWGESVLMARNPYDATQHAYALYGQENVIIVWQDNVYE